MPEIGTIQWTVIVALIILAAIIIWVYKAKSIKSGLSSTHNDESNEIAEAQKEITVNEPIVKQEMKDEAEVIAAIMAAVCSYTNLSSDEFKIKSIRRVSETGSNWRKAGII